MPGRGPENGTAPGSLGHVCTPPPMALQNAPVGPQPQETGEPPPTTPVWAGSWGGLQGRGRLFGPADSAKETLQVRALLGRTGGLQPEGRKAVALPLPPPFRVWMRSGVTRDTDSQFSPWRLPQHLHRRF